MRVFKIFLIVFFSLVGIVGATIGIMFATGYFDDDRLPPDEIHFEQSVYNEEANFSMTITSNSLNTEEGVSSSMREVTLSFRDADTYEAEGKISNGIITVPKTVRLGEAFTVEVVQEINDEISALEGEDTYWNVGGQSTLVAQSVYQGARQVEAQVNIDVPVYSIDLLVGDSLDDIASGNTSQNFNVGASYVAQAKFIPAASQYLYGDSSTYKTVLIDLRRTADSVFATAGTEQGTYRIFTADQQVASLELVARTFRTGSANAEALNLVSALTGEDRRTELLRILSSSSNTVEDSATISQSVQRVTHYTVGNVSGEFEFNRSQRVYANYGDSSFGIQIFSNETLLNYKLEDVGIVAKIIQPDGSAAYPSSSTDVVISGEDWFNPVDANGDIILDEGNPVRAITPNFVVENSGRSYWDIAVQVEGARVVFDVYIRDDGDLEDSVTASNYPLQTAIWSTTNSVRSVITWNDESDVNLKYVDDTPVVRDEFNLLQNLTRNHSSYNVVKYIAYSNSNTYDVNTLIHNTIAENDSHINFGDPVLSSLLTNATSRCEIDGDILTTGEGTGSFYVLAMVIQTNYNGAPIYDSNNDYIIDSVVVDYATGSSVQPLIVNITKTLKEVSVGEFAATGAKNVVDGTRYILEGAQRVAGEPYSVDKNGDVYDFDKARLDPTPTTYTKLDGSTGTIEYTPAIEFGDTFDLTLTISSGEESILREAWNSGELRFEVYDYDSNQLSSAITYSAPSWTSDNSGTSFIITFTADANLTQDGYYYIVLVYDKKAEIVYEETVVEKLSVYDGKAYDFEFVYGSADTPTSLNTTADNRLTTTTNVEVDEGNDVVTAITTTYSFDGNPIDNVTVSGRYRTKVYDKYGNDISAEIYATQDGGRQNENGNDYKLVYSIENSSSSRTTALEKTLYVTQSQGNYELYGVRFYGDSSETPTTSIPSSSNIEITTNGGVINLTGAASGDSLIIFYLAVDGGEAEYYRVPAEFVNFSFETYLAELAEFFTIDNVADESDKTITFLKGSGVEYSLTVDANIIGIDDGAVRLNLTINPYYVLNSYSNSSSLGYTQTPSGRKVNVYAGAGSVGDRTSATQVVQNMIILEFERSVSASAFTVPANFEVINLDEDDFPQEGSSKYVGILYSRSYALGDINNVEIRTGENSYDFSITLALYGIPNVTFTLGDGYTNEGNTYVKTEPIYWTDENGIQLFDIATKSSPLVTFSERLKTTGGLALTDFTATVSNPVFGMTDGRLTRVQEIEGEQTVTVTISYNVDKDSEVILNLVLTILPDIVMGDASTKLANEDDNTTRLAFASYEGLGLMLTWGKTYSLEDILATFKKSGTKGASLTATDFELTISKGSESVTLAQAGDTTIELNNVLGLSSLVSLDFAELTITQKSADGSHIASQTFDVFLLPVEYPFVKYDESKWAGVNSDLKTLFSRAELESQDIYIELDGGTENAVFLNNFGNVAKNYGLYYTAGYTYSIENADPTETDNSKFASYDSNTGTIRTETVGSDTYIYLVARASSGGPEIFRVRFKIIANTELNTYYPYIIDADSALDRAGEYVSTESGAVTIDFSEEYTASVPNWLETGVAEPYARTRVMLQTINHDKVDGVRYIYALSKVTFSGNDYTSAKDIMSFASMKGSVLTIKNMNNYFVVYVSATAWMGTTNPRQIGEAVEYVIYVNSNTSSNYRLKESATETKDWQEIHPSITVSAGKKLDLSSGTNAVVLVNEVGGLTSVVKNELRAYVYNTSLGTQVASDITLDPSALTVTLNKAIVSDYEVTLMLYTRYGVLAEVPLTFESAISHTMNIAQNTDGYYIYADESLTASNIAKITGAKLTSATMTITREDGSEVVSDVASYTFPKSSVTNTYHVTVACALTGFADPYIYSFDLTVYRNVHSTYTSQTNPMPYGDNIKGGVDAKFTLYDIVAEADEEPTGDDSALFEFATAPDLTTDFSYEILTGSSAVVVGNITFTNVESTVDGATDTTPTITVPTTSVAQNTAVLIRIDYKLDDTNNYSAYIYFVVEPNYTLTTNYYSGLSAEHVYLASDGSFSFSFDDPQIFVSQDRVTTNNNNEITIRYDGANYANAVTVTPNGTLVPGTTDRYQSNAKWTVSWNTAGANYSQATLTFTIFVDDFIAGEYTMILYKEASSVFTAEVDSFETVYENGRESFVVPGGGAGGANVFSNAYQKLTFVVRGDIADTTDSADYIELKGNGVTISGNTRITSQDAGSTMTVYVYGAGAALTAGDGGNISTYINIASYANANPTTPISTLNLEDISTLGSVTFSHKLVVSYRGQNVPFETYKDHIYYIESNEEKALEAFKIDTTSEDEQVTTFSLFGTTTDTSALVDSFFTYSYQATLDFKVANSYSGYIEERLVGNNITNVLDTFGITRYNDAEFDQTYFINNTEVTLSSNVVLVVTKDFDLSSLTGEPTAWKDSLVNADNTLKPYVNFVNLTFNADSAVTTLGQNDFAYVAAQQTNDRTYNFQYTLTGAGNSGNIVIFSVTFDYGGWSDTQYVAVDLSTNYSIVLRNGTTTTSQTNSQAEPLILQYNTSSTPALLPSVALSSGAGSNNYIYVTRNNLTGSTNVAHTAFTNYEIENEELRKYISIAINNSGISLVQNGTNVLNYSDITGAIRFYDSAGYEFRYYVRLVGATDTKVEFDSIWDARTGEMGEIIYEGSKVIFADRDAVLGDSTASNYSRAVLNYVEENSLSDIDYIILVSNLNINSIARYNEALSTGDNAYLYDGELVSTVTNGNSNATANSFEFDFAVLGGNIYSSSGTIVQPLSFSFNSGSSTGELVTINFEINLTQRYVLSISSNNYLLNGEDYELLDFVSVRDAKYSNGTLGSVTLTNSYRIENISGEALTQLTFTRADSDSVVIALGESLENGDYTFADQGSSLYSQIASALEQGYTCQEVSITQDKLITMLMIERTGASVTFELVNSAGAISITTLLDTTGQKTWHLSDSATIQGNAHDYIFVDGSLNSSELETIYGITGTDGVSIDTYVGDVSDFTNRLTTSKSATFTPTLSINDQEVSFGEKTLTYRVSTNPYNFTNSGNVYIDHSGFTQNADGNYEVEFEDWTRGLNVYDYNGANLGSMLSYKDGLNFQINEDQTSAGAATLDKTFKITTGSAFTMNTSSIIINVYAKAYGYDAEAGAEVEVGEVLLGSITVILRDTLISAPAQGTYTVEQRDSATTRSAFVSFLNQTYYYISDLTAPGNVYGFEQDTGGAYTYTLRALLKNVEGISLNASNLYIELSILEDPAERAGNSLTLDLVLNSTGISQGEEIKISFPSDSSTDANPTITVNSTSTLTSFEPTAEQEGELKESIGQNQYYLSGGNLVLNVNVGVLTNTTYASLYQASRIDLLVTSSGTSQAETASITLSMVSAWAMWP